MSDLIERQAAIDAVAEGLKRTFVEYREVAEKMLNKVPSAERKKAVWRHEPRKKSWIFYCSACGATAYWPQNNRTDTPARCQYKICPSCGAEMEAKS